MWRKERGSGDRKQRGESDGDGRREGRARDESEEDIKQSENGHPRRMRREHEGRAGEEGQRG